MSRAEGASLLGLFLAFLVFLGYKARKQPEHLADISDERPLWYSLVWIVISLILLPFCSHWLVTSGKGIAVLIGIPDVIIGLTLFALGTSLPELATCIVGVVKREYGLVAGNLIGSNIFNLTVVLAPAGLIHPFEVHASILYRDIPALLIFTGVLLVFYYWRGRNTITRIQGAGLFLGYCTYLGIVIAAAK